MRCGEGPRLVRIMVHMVRAVAAGPPCLRAECAGGSTKLYNHRARVAGAASGAGRRALGRGGHRHACGGPQAVGRRP